MRRKAADLKFRLYEFGTMQYFDLDDVYHNVVLPSNGVYDMHIMQCIGLKDCDGKEIYESDIVSSGNSVYVVVWSSEHAQFFFSVINSKTTLVRNLKFPVFQYAIDGVCGVEVIGNIYENAEIIENGHS